MNNAEHETYRVGEIVHYRFNGDAYTCKVTRVTKTQVHTDSTLVPLFTLRKGGVWRSAGHGTWTLGKGALEERNPCF